MIDLLFSNSLNSFLFILKDYNFIVNTLIYEL